MHIAVKNKILSSISNEKEKEKQSLCNQVLITLSPEHTTKQHQSLRPVSHKSMYTGTIKQPCKIPFLFSVQLSQCCT